MQQTRLQVHGDRRSQEPGTVGPNGREATGQGPQGWGAVGAGVTAP